MTYYDLYKNDWQGFGDIEEVSYFDGTETVGGVKARQIEPSQEQFESIEDLISLEDDVITFNLWDVTLSGKKPAGNGVITQADGTKWNVQSVVRAQWRTQHHCLCIKQVT